MTTDEGDIVLDPFVGTGTTAIAAKRLGRKYIAIDIDLKYVEITKKKLRSTKPTKINGCYVSIYLGKIITIRDKDWGKIKKAFIIPSDPKEVEKNEVKLKKHPEIPSLFEYYEENNHA